MMAASGFPLPKTTCVRLAANAHFGQSLISSWEARKAFCVSAITIPLVCVVGTPTGEGGSCQLASCGKRGTLCTSGQGDLVKTQLSYDRRYKRRQITVPACEHSAGAEGG